MLNRITSNCWSWTQVRLVVDGSPLTWHSALTLSNTAFVHSAVWEHSSAQDSVLAAPVMEALSPRKSVFSQIRNWAPVIVLSGWSPDGHCERAAPEAPVPGLAGGGASCPAPAPAPALEALLTIALN